LWRYPTIAFFLKHKAISFLAVTFRAALTGARGQHERSEDQRPKADRIERETFAVELSNNQFPAPVFRLLTCTPYSVST
jgi:hypothetical protein